MFEKKLAAAVLAFGALGVGSLGLAEEPSSYSGPGTSPNSRYATSPDSTSRIPPRSNPAATLADRIDSFAREIFGGIFPDRQQRNVRRSAPKSTSQRYSSQRNQRQPSSTSHRAGSILTHPRNTPAKTKTSSMGGEANALDYSSPKVSDPTSQRKSDTTWRGLSDPYSRSSGMRGSRPVRQPSAANSAQQGGGQVLGGPPSHPAGVNRADTPPRKSSAGLAGLTNPVLRPLHERLMAFRRSAFGEKTPSRPEPNSDPAADPQPAKQPPPPATESPTVATPEGPTTTTSPERVMPAAPIGRPLIPRQPLPATRPDDLAADAQPTPTPAASSTATAEAGPKREESLLFARKSPVLSVETVGPRKIAVGKESAYEVSIRNSGEVAADEVVVFVNLPAWADVLGAEVSTGATHVAVPGESAEAFQWRVGHLEASGRERLVLRIVPRESRPFDLAVRWDCKPVASQATIEVQEAKLVTSLEGPREVLYGEKEIFKLTVSNTGTGDAENVAITLMPIGTGDNQPVSHNLGVVQAGGQKTIEVELTARQVGDLMIKVDVRGDGGVHAELAEKVLVRRARLQVDVQGPKVQFVGAQASYLIRVGNPGTAPARNLNLSVNIPPGAKYLSGVDGGRLEANGTKVAWVLESLDAGAEKDFLIKCSLGLPGPSRLEVASTADGDLTASAGVTTQVEAMADLVLDVKDPTGPIPVGEETTYEVRIQNRGTKNAQNVEVLAYFSQGIEPTRVEGGQHRISSGQVVFSPIASVAAGGEVALTIRARAETAGNHVFRTEVHCKTLGTRLVSEGTTHFYLQEPTSQDAPNASYTQRPSPRADGSIRAADRRHSPTASYDGAQPPPASPQGRLIPVAPQGRPTPATRR